MGGGSSSSRGPVCGSVCGSLWRGLSSCARSDPATLIGQKASIDAALALLWIPSVLLKVMRVAAHTCYPHWRRAKCARWTTRSAITPLSAFGIVAVLFCSVYVLLVRKIRSAPGEKQNSRVYNYFLIFLWLHVYWSCAWIVTCVSMYLWHMVWFIAFGIAHDAFVISRVARLRCDGDFAPETDSMLNFKSKMQPVPG